MDSEIGGWRFKEVRSKKGQIIVFGKLDEYLLEYYKITTLGGLDQFRSNYQEQYIVNCPFCQAEGHTKKKLHILPNTTGINDFSTGYCFVCGRTFVHITDNVDIHYRVPEFLNFSGKFESVPISDKFWTLDKFNEEFDFYSDRGINYLEKRNPYLKSLWKPLGFKFYEDHVAMPFKDPEGNLVYYQIRFIDADKSYGVRFHFPIIQAKPPYILHTQDADPENLIICEGIFDCIAAWIQSGGKYVCIALMGSKVSDYQLAYIRNWYMPKKILFWLDETELSLEVLKRFNSIFNYSKMRVIKSSGSDPEEILIHRLRVGKPAQWIKPEYGESGNKLFFPKFKLNMFP